MGGGGGYLNVKLYEIIGWIYDTCTHVFVQLLRGQSSTTKGGVFLINVWSGSPRNGLHNPRC